MNSLENKTLFIFIDESGNFDFSPKGTKYFVLTCISTINPFENRDSFLNLKYKLLGEGINEEYFHATEDKQDVRNQMFSLIGKLNDFGVDSVIAQKNKVNWSLYEALDVCKKPANFKFKIRKVQERFYKQISETLLQYVIRRYTQYRKNLNIEKIIIVLGALFSNYKQEFIKKYLKSYFKENFQKTPYIYFHQVKTDINCQIADYFGWAIFVKWERREMRSYNQIQNKINSEFDIFEKGDGTIYYEYKK